jgi:hypothetical protein
MHAATQGSGLTQLLNPSHSLQYTWASHSMPWVNLRTLRKTSQLDLAPLLSTWSSKQQAASTRHFCCGAGMVSGALLATNWLHDLAT